MHEASYSLHGKGKVGDYNDPVVAGESMIKGPWDDHENHKPDKSPPYIDNLFIDTSTSQIVGTAGHSLNHAKDGPGGN